MLSRLSPAELAVVEEWMSQHYEYQSRFFRKLVAQGKAEGLVEAVLAVLEARGLDVPGPVAERVRACRDIDKLEAWLQQAKVIRSVDELAD